MLLPLLILIIASGVLWLKHRQMNTPTLCINKEGCWYRLTLKENERLVGSVELSQSSKDTIYLEIRGELCTQWAPRIRSRHTMDNQYEYTRSAYIQVMGPEVHDWNSTDPLVLGRAYESIQQKDKARSHYEFATHGDDDPSRVFYALYRIAVIDMDRERFLRVYHYNPHRKEPLYYLTRFARTAGNYTECLLYARSGLLVGAPSMEELYVETHIYRWALEEEFAACLYATDRREEALNQWKRLLEIVPESVKGRIDESMKLVS